MMQACLDSLTGSVDDLRSAANTQFDDFDARLTELSSSFNTMALNQQAFFDNIYRHFPPPPPPPSKETFPHVILIDLSLAITFYPSLVCFFYLRCMDSLFYFLFASWTYFVLFNGYGRLNYGYGLILTCLMLLD